MTKNNTRLKAAIVREFGAQYKFARALNIQETIVSRVVCGHMALSNRKQKIWARVLNEDEDDIRNLFPKPEWLQR